MSVLAIIPARSGSKGIKNKNIRSLCGKALISWTIEAALEAGVADKVIVSTDCEKIARVALYSGAEVPFLRPAALATDTASTTDVILHAVGECPGFDNILLLQPTSPMRTSNDIKLAFREMSDKGADTCVSVYQSELSPWLMYRQTSQEYLESVLDPWPGGMRRQDLPAVYLLNGAIYIAPTDFFLRNRTFISGRTHGFIMSEYHSIDIDTMDDFVEVEKRLLARNID